ncbi:MAG: radical SAM protein [Flavobacteriaceae bacterium]|nr:radical SAM protein [Eudoraea sp.]NNL16880.1 radical SAM protein [Flavobacteriaceae bacterium]
MKILLIRPPVPKYTIGLKNIMVCEPLGLEYVAAGVDSRQHIKIFDCLVENGLSSTLEQFKPDIVGLNCYITGVNEVIKICRKIKEKNHKCLTVVGGVHATKCPEDFIDISVDVIAMGDGIKTFAKIIEYKEQGLSLTNISGLAFPLGPDKLHITSDPEPMENVDELPFPRRDLVKHLSSKYYYIFHEPLATIKTTWGCWYKCNFCYTWTITNGKVFSRSPESIADELELIEQEDIYIVDDIFLIKPKRLERLRELIIERNIRKKFLVFGRADFIAQNEKIIKEWSEIGLTAVLIGLEASTDTELNSMNKESCVNYNYEAIRVLSRNGVETYGSLIPQPDYTDEDWKHLYEFIEDTGLIYVNISPLTPLPGTSEYEKWRSKITVPRKAHGLWDLSHVLLPTNDSLKKYYQKLLWLYVKTCMNLGRIKKHSIRKLPPWYNVKRFRLIKGILKCYLQFRFAHWHHRRRFINKAMYRGPDVAGLRYKTINEI